MQMVDPVVLYGDAVLPCVASQSMSFVDVGSMGCGLV